MSAPYLDPRLRRNPFRRGNGYGATPQFTQNTFTGEIGQDRSADRVSAPSSITLGSNSGADPYGKDEAGNPFIKSDRQMAQEKQANNDMITARDAGAKDARIGSEYAKGYAGGSGGTVANPATVGAVGATSATTPPPAVSGGAPTSSAAPSPLSWLKPKPTIADRVDAAQVAPPVAKPAPAGPQSFTPDETATAMFMGRQKQIAPAVTATSGVNAVSGPGGTAMGTRQDPYLTAQQRAQQGTVAIPGGPGIAPQNVPTQEAQRLASPQTTTLPDGSTKQVPSLLAVTDGPGAVNNSVTQNNVAGAVQNAGKMVVDKKSKSNRRYSPFAVNRG